MQINIDMSKFQWQDLEVEYEYQPYLAGGFDEPPTPEDFCLTSVKWKGVEIVDALDERDVKMLAEEIRCYT